MLPDRYVRKLVMLFNVEEYQVRDDLEELQRKINRLGGRADQDDVDHQEDLRSRMLLSSLEV